MTPDLNRTPNLDVIRAVDPALLTAESRIEFEMTKLAFGLVDRSVTATLEDLLEHRPAKNVSRYLTQLARLALLATDRELIDPVWAMQIADAAVAADPEDAAARYQLAAALSSNGEQDAALRELRAVAEDPEYGHSYEVLLALGAAEYNSHNYRKAAELYERALLLADTAIGHLYLADALAALNDVSEAQEHYRRSLLLNSTSLEALNGYWFFVDRGSAPPTSRTYEFLVGRFMTLRPPLSRWVRPLVWRLLMYRYRRHPEDARLHYMLGFTALLRGDLTFASERLAFIYEFTRPADLEALASLAVAQALRGRLQDARETLIELRNAPTSVPIPSEVDIDRSLAVRPIMVLSPLVREPSLQRFDHTDDLLMLLEEVFGSPPSDLLHGR
jgi:tetratricopeptide (TPR) repeat protein